jgi:tRNA threonylcarbamoyladenosine biosynthesis protein TsaB
MKILALEFSSPRRSVAVVDGETVLAEQSEAAGQSVPPLRLIEQALQAARVERGQIECVAVGLGPGSYTGVRSAIALAQGWQLAAGVKLLGVGTGECLAAQAQAENIQGRIHVVVDAQRNELYLAGYEINGSVWKEIQPLRLVTLAEAQAQLPAGETIIGPEATRWFTAGRVIFPGAATLGRVAAARTDYVSGEQLEPIYLRATSFVKAPRPLEFKL